jgi:Uncharacterized alpha/beta hydrolase domain (DUF2235)
MKHLIICLDGTWSDANDPAPQTNIALLAGIIEPRPADPQQRVYYDSGVGTGGSLVDRIAGGLFGKGLGANVLAAYRFLSQFYAPGDNIYVFGFSRGAFTARSLCGFLSASGLLTQDMCNAANQEFAWNYYRTPPKQRFPADRARLKRITHPDTGVRFLGVFDTVGALGIPKGFMSRISRGVLQFHDADVSSIAEHCCHALAIDEYRLEFEASVWTEPSHRNFKHVEQAWFPGSHSNIGGGYDDTGLSDLALEWMLKRLQHHCPELRLKPPGEWPRGLKPDYRGRLHDPRSWMFWRSRWRPLMRLINRCEIGRGWSFRLPQVRPHSRPIGEMVHWSALARWEETKSGRRRHRYQPRNLIAAIKSVQESATPVVGVDGQPTSLAGLYTGTATAVTEPRHEPKLPAPPRAPAANGANGASGAGKVANGARARP